MVTSNARSIKVWKLFEKMEKKVMSRTTKDLQMPKLHPKEACIAEKEQLVLPNMHQSDINSINTSGNQEYLLSSDDSRCLLWSF